MYQAFIYFQKNLSLQCPYKTIWSLLLNSGQKKKWLLLACESLEFQLCYPLDIEELKFCFCHYVEISRDLG